MLIGQKGVKYGLQVRAPPGARPAPGKAPAKKRSVFGDEDDEEDAQDNVEQQIARQAARKQSDKKVAELHAAALAEDASIFDYDSHYDSIQEARAEPKKQDKLQRQSRYIAGLLEKAEERKQEQDILYERQLAKERAAEDHLFGDTEKFVTAAYKAKLAERQAWQAEQKRKKEEEEANAVEKRGHMGDFYRNLLRSNVAFGSKKEGAGKPEEGKGKAPGRGTAAECAEPRVPGAAQAEMEAALAAEAAAARGTAPAAHSPPPLQQQEADQRRRPPSPAPAPAAAAGTRIMQAAAGEAAGPSAAAEQPAPAAAEPATDAAQRRNKEDAVAAARERFLARKRQRTAG